MGSLASGRRVTYRAREREREMDGEEITTILGKGSWFEGKLTFEGTVRIDGRFSGEIQTEGTLIIGESAEVQANIRASTVVVKGKIQGDVAASESLTIQAPAKVTGNLATPNLMIEKGSFFEGHCSMSRENLAAAPVEAGATG